MSVLKYILPALAVVGSASAACSVAATTTIQNAGDASAIATCSTFSGSVAIATGTTDNINIASVRRITGDLTASNVTQLTTLGADTLDTIDGTFSLDSMTILSSLSFPRLATVGTIRWNALPGLQSLTFATGVQKANEVNIQNTQLQSLDGINLQTVATFYIANNNFLSRMSLQLANVSNTFTVEANGGQDPVDVVLPNLIWANNMTFRNCNTISIPSLQALNGSMGFFSGGFDTLSTANLTSVGGSLIFSDNSNMVNISMPLLTRIDGGFTIGKNPNYKQVNGFPQLQTIVGALDFSGNFTSVSLPALKDVRGAFNVQSSADISNDCNHFNSIKGSNSVIKGKYTCAGSQSRPGGANTTPTGTSSSSTATKTGAASHMGVSSGAVVGLAGVLAAMLGMF